MRRAQMTKGELEFGLAALGFERLVIARPGFLLTVRDKPRAAEAVAGRIFGMLASAAPSLVDSMAVHVGDVATAVRVAAYTPEYVTSAVTAVHGPTVVVELSHADMLRAARAVA